MSSLVKSLQEGKSYLFIVGKKVLLPDNTEVFILKGPEKRRFMIEADRYRRYGLESGKEISCRVDKINCKGEVFLEPQHPYYKEMHRYPFTVINCRKVKGSKIRKGKVLVVKDHYGDEHILPVPAVTEIPSPGSVINLLIVRIKKGSLQLAFDMNDKRTMHLEFGKDHQFEIAGSEIDFDGEEYYVVVDQLGVTHPVKKRYYEHYGLKNGVKFTGRVVKQREDGQIIIEPDNPFYKPGQFIEIVIERKEKNGIDDSWYIEGADRFGNRHELRVTEIIAQNKLICRVEMIRKGKPLLIPVYEDIKDPNRL